ncbi:MAG: GNAT family N-acetyltransferase [Chloroflexota bacterium]
MPGSLILRPFRDEDDYARLAAILTASENADSHPATVSAAFLAERLNTAQRFDLRGDLAIAEMDGQAVGYGRVSWQEDPSRRTYSLAGFLLPEWRRLGIGQALLAWQEGRAWGIAGEHPTTIPGFLHINATQYQVGLHALAQQAGYHVKESWVLMVRHSLADIPDALLPEGLEVRPARPEHYAAIWYAAEEAYVPEGGPPPTGKMPQDFKDDPNFQPELWQVAWEVDSGKVAGSVLAYINHAENEQLGILRGYTEGISTVPAWQRRGVARALIARSLKEQRQAGMTESALVCSGEKPNNYRLYASCGFQEVKRDTVYEKPLAAAS